MTSQYILLKTNSYIIRMNREDHLCWFHGKISREHAEEILREEGKGDGVFLVRECNTSIGDFVLSVLHQGEVWHYQIRRHGEDAFFSIDDHTKIHGLDSLIEHYQQSSNGLVTQLSAIIKRDPPPNDSRSHGRTNLLHRATKANDLKVVSELLKSGYRNFDAKSQDGQTSVHIACIHSNEEILKLLLNAGANVNCRDTAGNTPLHYACRTKSASYIRTLIDAKANIQMRNIDSGYVPLHDAAKFGNMEALKELLKAQAPHMPRTSNGEFPMDCAREAGFTEIAEFLQNYKPSPATTYKYQWYHGTLDRTEAVKLLQEHAATLRNHEVNDENGNKGDADAQVDSDQKLNGNKAENATGVFLVRYSNRSGYVLTLLCENQPKNFQIQSSQMKYMYIDEGPFLPSLEHLVQHYSIFQDGLPVNLRHPVPPKPKPPLPLFSTMPKVKKREQDASKVLRSTNSNETNIHTPQRILSHPGDDAMNRVGLFENDDHVEDGKKKREMAIFRSFKPSSPKRNVIIDGMKSLRKAKLKTSPLKRDTKRKLSHDDTKGEDNPLPGMESLLKDLSFSTDFLNKTQSSLYNIPTNNCAVVDIDIGEGENSTKNQLSKTSSTNNKQPEEKVEGNDNKNRLEGEPDEEYFTKSDKVISTERDNAGTALFVDAPPPVNIRTYPLNTGLDGLLSFTGYVPTVDLRIFSEDDKVNPELLAESSAELRELSKHPERLASMISTASTDSELSTIFKRQSSCTSASSPENSRTKLNYFIPNECLTLEEIIGEGEFGSVYKGNLIRGAGDNDDEVRYPVAIKTLRDEHCRTNKQEFLREASVMIRLQHHCIVKLIGISKGKTLMMVQELVPVGSMLNFIVKHPDKINPNYELKIWASQIACGMNYLESQHFVHRDLAARNILLASRNQAKISDFGLSRALGSGNDCYQASQGGKWPIKWYAPESFNHGVFSHASDVWSFGVTLWEMFSLGEPPYGEMRGVDAIKLIEQGHRLAKPTLCPDNVYKIMENCWNYKPKDRPTFRFLTEFFAKDPNYQNLTELIKTEHIS